MNTEEKILHPLYYVNKNYILNVISYGLLFLIIFYPTLWNNCKALRIGLKIIKINAILIIEYIEN